MSTLDRDDHRLVLHTKGAPEESCRSAPRSTSATGSDRDLTADRRTAIGDVVRAWAADGLRVLALADRTVPESAQDAQRDDLERDLTLLGVVGMVDPPRPEVPDAVARCHTAGIRLLVVTGDHG